MSNKAVINRIFNRDKPPYGLNLALKGVDGYVMAPDLKPSDLAEGDTVEYELGSKRIGQKTAVALWVKKVEGQAAQAPAQSQGPAGGKPQGGYQRGGNGGGYNKDRKNENGVSGVNMNSAVARAIEFVAMLLANNVLKLPVAGEKGHTPAQQAKIVEFLEEVVKERTATFYAWSESGITATPAKDKGKPAAAPVKPAEASGDDSDGDSTDDLHDPFNN